MDLMLSDRRALITGSSSGIGAGLAKTLAREQASVVIHGRDGQRANMICNEIRSVGGHAVVVLGDITTDDGADEVSRKALEAFGGIDILVNNAGGIQNPVNDWFAMPVEDWLGTYNLNIGSTVRLVKRLCPSMVERGWGRVVQIGSTAGQSGVSPGYASAKAALVNLSFGLSKALKSTGVTVNTVAGGMIETPLLESFFERTTEAQGFGNDRERTVQFVIENTMRQAVSRLGIPDDIANMVAYLCSPLADFITGANMRVDGGSSPSI